MPPDETGFSGGCQCGAVRFRAARLGRSTICHCRMCQKAFGSFFGPFVTGYDLVWTRGVPKHFQSSENVQRGFCAECGTPLTFEMQGHPHEVAVGALDDPTVAAPSLQVNLRDKLAFFDGLTALPSREESPGRRARFDQMVSFQHPDHDTADWPRHRTDR